MILNHPNELKWNDGPLPLVEDVPYSSRILVWITTPEGELMHLTIIHPWMDNLNPLRWCVNQFPLLGYLAQYSGVGIPAPEKDWIIKYWAWIVTDVPTEAREDV